MPLKPLLTAVSGSPVTGLIKRFFFSGGIATAIHWSVLWLLIIAGISSVVANAIGAFIGAVANYFLQYHITFRCQTNHLLTGASYLTSGVVSWLANSTFFYLLIHNAGLSVLPSQIITTAVITALNFTLYHYLVFHEQ